MNVKKNDIIELEIVDLNNLGCGVGRTADGVAVFVKGAVTGDRVSAKINILRRDYQITVLRAVSIDRIVGDGFPVPQPAVYGFAGKDAETIHFTAGTGNPSPTRALVNRFKAPSGS